MLKVYRLTRLAGLNTVLVLKNKKVIPLKFVTSFDSQNISRGVFITTDPDVQWAMENDNSFNVQWFLETIDGKHPKAFAASAKNENGGEKENEKETTDPDVKVVPEITKHQEAKEYLLANFPDRQPGDFKSKDRVFAFAAANKLSFPNLV